MLKLPSLTELPETEMKNSFFFLFIGLLIGFNALGSHVAGAEIFYRYIGDSTGVANQYEITLKVYRDATNGIGFNTNTEDVCIKSNCFTTFSATLSRILPPIAQQYNPTAPGIIDRGILVPGLYECQSQITRDITMHVFRGTTTIPGGCTQDISIFWELNARNASDNLVNSNLSTFYVESILNRRLGNNNSPQFVTPAAKSFCVGSPFVWVQAASEEDGDSIRYAFGHPQRYTGFGCGGTPVNEVFQAGYTVNSPLTPFPGTSIVVNPNNGSFSFTPGAIESVVLRVDCEEYRYDSIFNTWERVGMVARDMQVVIGGACLSSVTDGPKIDVSGPNFYTDTISGGLKGSLAGARIVNDSIANPNSPTGYDYIVPVIDYVCLDTSVSIKFDIPIQCGSIDGSEFRVIGPDTVPRPVFEVIPNCGLDLEADEMVLRLLRPLSVNGDYFVYVKDGLTDGNTFTNNCGFELQEFYTFILRVDGCFQPNYSMENVSIDNNYNPRIEFELDTTSFPTYLFDYLEIYRSDDMGATYNMVSTYNGQLALTTPEWSDLSLNTQNVNTQNYDYRIKMLVNGEPYDLSNSIRSILLDTMVIAGNPAPAIDEMPLKWSRYNGWANAEYTVMLGNLGTGNWNPISQTGSPTTDTTFYFQIPADSGDYAVRVDASNPAGGNYIASSNWILFSVTVPPIPVPDDVEVPNVFTPNGDNVNDLFTIKNIQQYSQTSMTVFNRWGAKVYETSNYTNDWDGTDQNSGQKLADGVYYYIINMKDEASGKTQNFEGSVTIFNGN